MFQRRFGAVAAVLLVAGVAAWSAGSGGANVAGDEPGLHFGEEFWRHWGDGRAEIATYDLVYPRYGEPRPGTAVTIFVTETFSERLRVKADPGVHPRADEFPVMKLNLVQDFATGIYDYNLMTSVFTGLAPHGGRPAGAVAKVSFSSQEWCGHVYHQLLPGGRGVRSVSHSYFDGEADRDTTLRLPANAMFEDALFAWVRGFAPPRLSPGDSTQVMLLDSPERSRLLHRPLAWESATLSRAAHVETLRVAAGTFVVDTFSVGIPGSSARRWTFQVETSAPHRIVRWETSDGKRAELVAAQRVKYWERNGSAHVADLAVLGLLPRPARTP